ncbi:MAG TPA: LLM class F420-dependent oxidoreductase [Actinomycetota bacterium]|nr:LLM class F420-dependent oxidoreductase [Actinomycetota bacterium]
MKFGVTGVNAGRRVEGPNATILARLAEDAGFESLWTVEHVVVPANYKSQYPYSDTGRMPGKEEVSIGDPLIWLAYAAAVTERINLATGILILPQRNPVLLAKECATLDTLSNGRLLLGIGVGWLQEEFDALGVPFEERGARTDEYVEALRVLWRDAEPTFGGRFATFDKAKSYPKPPRDSIPIIVGGHTDAAARRAGRIGDGFFPWGLGAEHLTRLLGIMREAATEAGRDPDAVEVTAGAMDVETIRAYADTGVSRVVVPAFARTEDELKAWFDTFNAEVMAKLG